jgi:hypothetical protein
VSLDFHKLKPSQKEDCPSDLALDRLHGGELSNDAKGKMQSHVDGCLECQTRMKQRQEGFNALPGVDERVLLAKVRTRLEAPPSWGERLRQLWAPLGAITAAALVALVSTGDDPEPPEATRMKGSHVLHVYRLAADGKGQEVLPGETFNPGDRVRFTVDLAAEQRVRVFGREANGALYVAWPREASDKDVLAQGKQQELPGAIVLDQSKGKESFTLVTCAAAVEPKCEPSSEGLKCPKECAVAKPFVFEKQVLD